jgi:N-dimethylarginine dimethylaminohydrolase
MHSKTPSQLDFPALVMNFPFTADNRVINNPLMDGCKDVKYDYDLAFKQFMSLYKYLSKEALVYLLPSEGNFQDQTFVANLACYLPHTEKTVILSKFKSEPRIGEDEIGLAFFKSMGYSIIQPKTTFEGEADLKFIRENLYIGGHGVRTARVTHDWIAEQTNARIIPVEMGDDYLYHFDCLLLPLTRHKALVATEKIRREDLKRVENIIDVISVPTEYLYYGWTNCMIVNNRVIYTPPTAEIGRAFEKFIAKQHFDPVLIDLSEFEQKSGAGISCMIMHLNYLTRPH